MLKPASIMMVTYNRLELTKQTLDILFKNTKYPFKLCVVDNASQDETIKYLNEEIVAKKLKEVEAFQSFHLRRNSENKGIAIARNQALTMADTDWLVTFDNDVSVPEGWLTEAINILEKNPQYGGIGVNMENKQYPIVEKNGCIFQNKSSGNLGTACMVFNRKLHKMLGFFNHKDYEFYGHEDADWGMRTRVLGLKLGYIKENGKHLGEGELDQGEYREFKNKYGKQNLNKFYANSRSYARKEKSLYINFIEE